MKDMDKLMLLTIVCVVLVAGLDALEDTLVHHYDTSIFAPLGHDSYWYPDWTRAYINGDPAQGRKWFVLLPGGAMLLDGWHLVKNIIWGIFGTLLYVWWLFAAWNTIYWIRFKPMKKQITAYLTFMATYSLIIYIFHGLFYHVVF